MRNILRSALVLGALCAPVVASADPAAPTKDKTDAKAPKTDSKTDAKAPKTDSAPKTDTTAPKTDTTAPAPTK